MADAQTPDGDSVASSQSEGGVGFNPLEFGMTPHGPRMLSGFSAWISHIPFAFVAMEIIRPAVLVELGTAGGDSYFSFCQAVVELGLPTRCTAIDTWKGDPHFGYYSEELFLTLRGYHDPLYGAFSRLLRGEFDQAAVEFPDGSIDLLHIDGCHTYEAVKHDFETWLPKLSRRAVVLFHDTQARHEGFGVWKFWAEVSSGYPNFEFHHGSGLGVLAVGAEVSPNFLAFLQVARQYPEVMRAYFASKGSGIEAENRLVRLCFELRHQHSLIDEWARTAGQAGAAPAPDPALAQSKTVEYARRLSERLKAVIKADLDLRQTVSRQVPPGYPS
jgi:methyltransferase family protein